jgi:hypothetical protein
MSEKLETTIMLEISTGKIIHRLPFASKRSAMLALNALKKKMGERFSNDPDKRTHTIKNMAGVVVVETDEVNAVNLVDYAKYIQASKPIKQIEMQTLAEERAAMEQAKP